jgi:hypothetical protein
MKVELRRYVLLVQRLAEQPESLLAVFSLPPLFTPTAGGILQTKSSESPEA